jgi:tetratricopeptide (TPR) repeat protein
MSESAPVDPRKKLDAELKRLQAKQKETTDRDIRAALDLAIKGREEELAQLGGPLDQVASVAGASAEPDAEVEVLPEPPTPEVREQAEKLIQQARLERRRQNNTRAAELLDEALRLAPGASDVQELVGDDFMERKQWKAAMARYDMARKLDEKNVSADKKFAELVFQTKAAAATAELSLEYQRDQMVGSAQKAALFSLFLPGSGQILLGENWYGGMLMGGWAILVFWVWLWAEDVKGVLNAIGLHAGKLNHYTNYGVVLPIFGALLIHVISVFSAAAEGASAKLPIPERPVPPVPNLPFE